MNDNPKNKDNLKSTYKLDAVILAVTSLIIFFIAAENDALEVLFEFSRTHEDYEIDEILTLAIISSLSLCIFSYRRWQEMKKQMTIRLATETKLNYLIHHDPLTNIPNRTFFTLEVTKSINRHQLDGSPLAVMLLDLDKFKQVNDIYGHRVGDLVLIETAARLQKIVGKNNLCARLGGDEYALLFDNADDIQMIANIANKIIDILHKPFQVEYFEIELGTSIGVVISNSNKNNVVDLLRRADIAMYAAKKSPILKWQLFDTEMDNVLFRRQFLETELKKAIKQKKIDVYFQPIYNLKTQNIEYFEVLARWKHPELGTVAPFHFINVAEEAGLIFELGEIVIEKSFDEAMRWSKPYPVAINVSAHQIRSPEFIPRFAQYIEKYQISPSRIEIEITESVLIDEIDKAKEVITQLKEMGISIALDDFGTGYSSLSYLHTFDFDKLKIDQDFIQDINTKYKNKIIVSSLFIMCKEMGIELVVEGVECVDDYNYLIKDEFIYGQGFYLGKPTSAEATRLLISSSPKPK